MKTATYPALGSKVGYIRQTGPENVIETGQAIVEAICLDHTKRVMAHLSKPNAETNAPHDRFNVDLQLLDPSEETVAKFTEMAHNIQEAALEHNLRAKSIIDEGNVKIDAHRDQLLGTPVEFDALDQPKAANDAGTDA